MNTDTAIEHRLVSIIVPCYKQAPYLAECLKSIQQQTYNDWECIVIDSPSDPNCASIVQPICEKDHRFRYVLYAGNGVSANRNHAIRLSKGKWILPVDGDDKIGPDYVRLAVQTFTAHPETLLVYCKAEFFGLASGSWNLPPFHISTMLKDNVIFCSAFFKRSDYERVGGYSEEMIYGYEDWDLWLSLLEKCKGEVICMDAVAFFYRIKQKSESRNTGMLLDQKKQMLQLIYSRHRSLYDPFIPDLLLASLEKEELQRKYETLLNSKTYRISAFLSRWAFWNRKKN